VTVKNTRSSPLNVVGTVDLASGTNVTVSGTVGLTNGTSVTVKNSINEPLQVSGNVTVANQNSNAVPVRDEALLAAVLSLSVPMRYTFSAIIPVTKYVEVLFSACLGGARYANADGVANDTVQQILQRRGFVNAQGIFTVDLLLEMRATWSAWKASAGADYSFCGQVPLRYVKSGQPIEVTSITLKCVAGSRLSDSCSSVAASCLRNSVDLTYTRNHATLYYTYSRY
jgi:hypothetical protein